MKNMGLYTWFTWLDARKVGVWTHIVIITGICLPILVLLGLKNGQINQMQEQILTSKSGRCIEVEQSGKEGAFQNGFNSESAAELKSQYPEINEIVPGFSNPIQLTTLDGSKSSSISIHPSCKGDPKLASQNADIFDDTTETLKSIVLASSAARELDVHEGDSVKGLLGRSKKGPNARTTRSSNSYETVEIVFRVDKIIDIKANGTTREESKEGYTSLDLMLAMRSYQQGNEVKLFPETKIKDGKTVTEYAIDWPARNSQPQDLYSGFFVFTPKSSPLTDEQKKSLLGGSAENEIIPVNNSEIATMYGILQPEALEYLDVHFKRIVDPKHPFDPNHPEDVRWFTEQTSHGGMKKNFEQSFRNYPSLHGYEGSIIYWNQRLKVNVNGKPTWLVGLTMTKNDRWLKQFANNPDVFFDLNDSYDEEGVAYVVKGDFKDANDDYVTVDLDEKCKLKLKIQRKDETSANNSAALILNDCVTQTTTDESSGDDNNADVKEENNTTSEPAQDKKDATSETPVDEEGKAQDNAEPQSDPNVKLVTEDGAKTEGNDAQAQDVDKAEPVADPEDGTKTDSPVEDNAASEIKTETSPAPPSDEIQTTEDASENVLIIPAQLLSQIYDYLEGKATYAESINRFVQNPTDVYFDAFRVYAYNIRQVPELAKKIRKEHLLNVSCSLDSIKDMLDLETKLNTFIRILTAIILGFGIVTVFLIIKDSTDRKRKEIGIMRVMGSSRASIFYYVFLRSIIIAFGALALTFAGAYAIKYLIPIGLSYWNITIGLEYTLKDIILVSIGAFICCGIGTAIPAYKASQIDPFDAVMKEL